MIQRYEMGYDGETGDHAMVTFEFGEWCKFWEARKGYTPDDIRKAAKQLESIGVKAAGPGRPRLGAKPTLVQELCTRLGLSERHVRRALNNEPTPNTNAELRAENARLKARVKELEGELAKLRR